MLMGWVKLHREILEKAIWKCSTNEQKVVLITILLLANHKTNQWIWKGKKFKCEPGQFITSLKSLANYGNVSVKNVRTALLKFEKLEFLANDTASDGRLITIHNWDKYQSECITDGKPTGKAPAKDGQSTGKGTATNKNDKKDNNDNKVKIVLPWDDQRFIQIWDAWKLFRKENKWKTYSNTGEIAALSGLKRKAQGDMTTACQIILQSIENSWQGLFELKTDFKNKHKEYDIEEIYRNL